MNTAEAAKFNMIEQQIRPWEVLDRQVLDVLMSMDRVDFVEEQYKGLAYADCQIPLANQTRMLPPVIEGRMLQALRIQADDNILEIGSASGYTAACLATLGKQVLSIDSSEANIEFASQNASKAGLSNIEFKQANGLTCELEDYYDVIAVTASVSDIPDNLKQALSPGGRLFIVTGQAPVMQAMLITRTGDVEWIQQSLFETDLPALSV